MQREGERSARVVWMVLLGAVVLSSCKSKSAQESPVPPVDGPDCASQALPTTVYYYCDCARPGEAAGAASGCVPGSDGNAGTSPAAPRRTLASAMSVFQDVLPAGAAIAFCRGGAWDAAAFTGHNSRCTSERPCELRDDLGAVSAASQAPWSTANRPRLNASEDASTFTIGNGTTSGLRIWNLELTDRSAVPGNGARGLFLWGGTDFVDACNLQISDFFLAVQGGGFGATAEENGHHTIRHCALYRNQLDGILMGGSNLTIDRNYFENNGYHPGSHHQIYYQGGGQTVQGCGPGLVAHDVRITNNWFHVTDANYSADLRLNGSVEDLLVENNLIDTVGVGDISFGHGGYPYATHGARVLIRRNRLFTSNDTYKGIVVSTCADCEITDNLIVGPMNAIAYPDMGGKYTDTGSGNCGELRAGVSTGGIIRNNTYFCTGLCERAISNPTDYDGYAWDPSYETGKDYVVENNASWMNGTWGCLVGSGPRVREQANYCRSSGLAATALWVNPGADPQTADFTPLASGPLAGQGSATSYSPTAIGAWKWSPDDAGKPRSPPIDIGALVRE